MCKSSGLDRQIIIRGPSLGGRFVHPHGPPSRSRELFCPVPWTIWGRRARHPVRMVYSSPYGVSSTCSNASQTASIPQYFSDSNWEDKL